MGKNAIFKCHDHESKWYNEFKNSFLKIFQLSSWQINFGHFVARCAIFVRHYFLWVLCLSISGGIFVMLHFCKVSLFSNGIKGWLSAQCWVPFLLGVSDKDVLLFYSYGCQTNYLLFYQSFEEKLVMKHETIY